MSQSALLEERLHQFAVAPPPLPVREREAFTERPTHTGLQCAVAIGSFVALQHSLNVFRPTDQAGQPEAGRIAMVAQRIPERDGQHPQKGVSADQALHGNPQGGAPVRCVSRRRARCRRGVRHRLFGGLRRQPRLDRTPPSPSRPSLARLGRDPPGASRIAPGSGGHPPRKARPTGKASR
jgi:hypothetical protein